MNRRNALIILGLLIILTPYAGLPSGMRSTVTQVLGLLVLLSPFVYRKKSATHCSKECKEREHREEEEIDEIVDMG